VREFRSHGSVRGRSVMSVPTAIPELTPLMLVTCTIDGGGMASQGPQVTFAPVPAPSYAGPAGSGQQRRRRGHLPVCPKWTMARIRVYADLCISTIMPSSGLCRVGPEALNLPVSIAPGGSA
jgi:hypothetical protein